MAASKNREVEGIILLAIGISLLFYFATDLRDRVAGVAVEFLAPVLIGILVGVTLMFVYSEFIE